jgi:hypothetical protein
MQLKLSDSGLDTPALLKRHGFEPLSRFQMKEAGFSAHEAFRIPYFDVNGKRTSFARYRYLEDTRTAWERAAAVKAQRYVQAAKTVNEVYFPPTFDWPAHFKDPTNALIFTEGELKAGCAAARGVPVVALGGVWNFRSKSHNLRLLPDLEALPLKQRRVYILYDSDAAVNPQIQLAESVFAGELLRLGAEVRIARLPSLAPPAKTGLDDYIMQEGVEGLDGILARAYLFEDARALHEMNTAVAYAEDPGLVIRLDTGQRLSVRNFVDHAFAHYSYTRSVTRANGNVAIEEIRTAKEWIKWPARFSVPRITYAPGEQQITQKGEFNTWPGWGCLPARGDCTPWYELLDFVFAGAPAEERRWFEQWAAYPLQNPGTKLYTAVVVWGSTHGTGKSLIGHTLGEIYGRNWSEITERALHESHNEWAENKQFVMGDEITSGDKRLVADFLKSMITQRQLRLNPKYIPSYTVPDCINYYFTSNHSDAFYIEDNDRRYFIHELRATKPLPREFYRRYDAWLHSADGPAALFHHLLTLDISTFDPKAPAPVTSSKREMQEGGRSELADWLANALAAPDAVLKVAGAPVDGELFTPAELLAMFDPDKRTRYTPSAVGRELKRQKVPRAWARGAADSSKEATAQFVTSAGAVRLYALRNPDYWREPRPYREIVNAYEQSRSRGAVRNAKY